MCSLTLLVTSRAAVIQDFDTLLATFTRVVPAAVRVFDYDAYADTLAWRTFEKRLVEQGTCLEHCRCAARLRLFSRSHLAL